MSAVWAAGAEATADGRPLVGAVYESLAERTAPWLAVDITVTATNDAGQDSAELTVIIEDATIAPVARIGPLPALIEVGDVVSLFSQSLNSPETNAWSFGDGGSAEGEAVTHTWDAPGTYVVTLIVENAAGSDTRSATIEVVDQLPAPVAAIGSFEASPWVGETIVFEDASSNATEWFWDFGDGVTSAAINPLHSFTTSGAKTVTLTVSNRNGSDTTTVTVTPRLEPSAKFTFAPDAPAAGDAVNFIDQSANASIWAWDFGDGTTSAAQNPSHTYAAAGAYTVTLTVSTDVGDASTVVGTVTVDPPPPIPSLSANPVVGTALSVTTFTAAPAFGSGPIISYEIELGDGSPNLVNTTGVFTHTYVSVGTFPVRVRATGPTASSDWVSAPYTVNPPAAPQIDAASGSPNPVVIGGAVSFSASVSGTVDRYEWDFGDGNSSTSPAPSHTYGAVGSYTVVLTVFDDGFGRQASTSFSVTVDPPAAPQIDAASGSPNPVVIGGAVSFSASVSGTVDRYEWDFGDGNSSTSPAPSHTYGAVGSYTVVLTVFDDGFGRQASTSFIVTVDPVV